MLVVLPIMAYGPYRYNTYQNGLSSFHQCHPRVRFSGLCSLINDDYIKRRSISHDSTSGSMKKYSVLRKCRYGTTNINKKNVFTYPFRVAKTAFAFDMTLLITFWLTLLLPRSLFNLSIVASASILSEEESIFVLNRIVNWRISSCTDAVTPVFWSTWQQSTASVKATTAGTTRAGCPILTAFISGNFVALSKMLYIKARRKQNT